MTMEQVAWDVFFKYPFVGSYIAVYVPLKALAAGLVLIAAYLLWAKAFDERLGKRIFPIAFVATLAYFLLAYVDLATLEFASEGGYHPWCDAYNLCGSYGRASQVFLTPNPTSMIAWGAWSSALLTLITFIALLGYNFAKGLRPLADWVVKIAGPPVAVVAALYTAFLYMQWTARGVLVDASYVVLFALYMLAAAFTAVGALGLRGYAKLGAFAIGLIIAVYLVQMVATSMGLYRQDASEAWRLMTTGATGLFDATYPQISTSFWLGVSLTVASLITAAVGYFKDKKALLAASLVLLIVAVASVEFARLISAQLVPNS